MTRETFWHPLLQRTRRLAALTSCALLAASAACGGGVPITVRVDEFVLDVDLDETIDQAFQQFVSGGFLNAALNNFPEEWPASLPDIKYVIPFQTDPVPVDLSPEEEDTDPTDDSSTSVDSSKYDDINRIKETIKRIEVNRLIVRVEQSSLTVALPSLSLQIANDKNTTATQRQAWWTLGALPEAAPGVEQDLEFEFFQGGETYLNEQLADDAKEFAMRVVGRLNIDTETNNRRPGGKARFRLIAVITFFVEPKEAL